MGIEYVEGQRVDDGPFWKEASVEQTLRGANRGRRVAAAAEVERRGVGTSLSLDGALRQAVGQKVV